MGLEVFLQGKYELSVTTDILDEYVEIIEKFFSVTDAKNTLRQIMISKNVVQIIRYYELNVIEPDPSFAFKNQQKLHQQ